MAKRNRRAAVDEQGEARQARPAVAHEDKTSAVEEGVVALLNVAVPGRQCLVCGQDVENHAGGCRIWDLEQWINLADQEPGNR